MVITWVILFTVTFFKFGLPNILLAEESCSTKDFRSQLGPIRNQGDKSWCFAFAAADLVSQKTKKRVSAADLALTYLNSDADRLKQLQSNEIKEFLKEHPDYFSLLAKARKDKDSIGDLRNKFIASDKGLIDTGGSTSDTVFLANLKGLCLEKDFPSEDESVQNDLKKTAAAHFKLENKKKACIGTPQTDNTSAIEDLVSHAIISNYEKKVDLQCKREPHAPLIPVSKGMASMPEFKKKYEHDPVARKKFQDELFKTMNTALDQDKAVGIGYSLYSVARAEQDETDKHGDHASSIVGRKMINGKCHYLLRNTQGPACDYNAELKPRCSQGHVWVTEAELSDSLYEVIYLK